MPNPFSFNQTFAGVPFFPDECMIVRMGMPMEAVGPPSEQEPPRTHQAKAQILDEIDRLMSFGYLTDYVLPPNYPGKNLGALAFQWQIGPDPEANQIKIGDWYYPNTASRWSVFRGLATSSQVKAMLAATGGTKPQTFGMSCTPVGAKNPGNYNLQTYLYMLPPRPLAEHGGQFDGLFLITLVDERYYWQYNPVSLQVNKDTTWDGLVEILSDSLGVDIDPGPIQTVYGQPEADSQFWANQESAAVLLDAVAYNLGRIVVRDLDGTYTFQTPEDSQAIVDANRPNASSVVRMAGGDIFQPAGTKLKAGNLTKSKNSILPTSVTVTFPKYVTGPDPVPHYFNTRYQNPRPTNWYEESYGNVFAVNVPLMSAGPQLSGLTGTIPASGASFFALSGTEFGSGFCHTIHTTAKALYSGEANAQPYNFSGITSLALQLASDYFNTQAGPALDEVYPGTFVWTPEGIHDIIWSWSVKDRKASTRVMRTEWNQIIKEMQHGIVPVSGFSVIVPGVGGHSVAQTWRDMASGAVSRQSGSYTTSLLMDITANALVMTIMDASYLPTDNRWKAQIGNEIVLMEPTGGGPVCTIAQRAIDGTLAEAHGAGTSVSWISPDVNYGINLVTHGPSQFVFPGKQSTSGGIAEVVVIPQTQSVQALAGSGHFSLVNGVRYCSGILKYGDLEDGQPFTNLSNILLIDRNDFDITSGRIYDGQFIGYSPSAIGLAAPVYAVNEYPNSGTGGGGSSTFSGQALAISGTLIGVEPKFNFIPGLGIQLSGFNWPNSGSLDVVITTLLSGGTFNFTGTFNVTSGSTFNYNNGIIVNYQSGSTLNINSGSRTNLYGVFNFYGSGNYFNLNSFASGRLAIPVLVNSGPPTVASPVRGELGCGSGYLYQFNGTNYDVFSVSTGGVTNPGGIDTDVQYNDGGFFGGSSGKFTWNQTTRVLQILGSGGNIIEIGDPSSASDAIHITNLSGTFIHLATNNDQAGIFGVGGYTVTLVDDQEVLDASDGIINGREVKLCEHSGAVVNASWANVGNIVKLCTKDEAINIQGDITTSFLGTKIGTATSQTFGWYNQSPIAQGTAIPDSDITTVVANLNSLVLFMKRWGPIASG